MDAGEALLYGRRFYEDQADPSQNAAQLILPFVLDLGGPGSVVDVGCGVGTWLKMCVEYGIPEVMGIDGDWVDASWLRIPVQDFRRLDLKMPIDVGRRFDLAISLEIGEHLPEKSAETFVDSLVGLAPAILFSAAIPGQGGTGHINEQWQSYWVDKFNARGMVRIDAVSKRFWQDPPD